MDRTTAANFEGTWSAEDALGVADAAQFKIVLFLRNASYKTSIAPFHELELVQMPQKPCLVQPPCKSPTISQVPTLSEDGSAPRADVAWVLGTTHLPHSDYSWVLRSGTSSLMEPVLESTSGARSIGFSAACRDATHIQSTRRHGLRVANYLTYGGLLSGLRQNASYLQSL